MTLPSTACPLCWGLGEAVREDTRNNGRLFCWPCPHGCAHGRAGLVRTTVTPERAAKAARRFAGDRAAVMRDVASRWSAAA